MSAPAKMRRAESELDTATIDPEVIGMVRRMNLRTEPILTVIFGPETGRTIHLDADHQRLGRASECEVRLLGREVSRIHCCLTRRDSSHWMLVDKESTNGTFVNGARVTQALVTDEDEISIGLDTVIKFGVAQEDEVRVRINNYEASVTDSLTELSNRRHLQKHMSYATNAARGSSESLSLILSDIDEFKRVNDRHGHPIGDRVIRSVSDTMRRLCRSGDLVARYGGEEFAILLYNADADEAFRCAERIREAVGALRIPHDGSYIEVSISSGIATWSPDCTPMRSAEMIADADAKLGRAKADGRNRCYR